VLKILRVYAFHVLSAALIILLVFTVYWHDLEILTNEALNAEALSHILLVPFIVSYLFYQKKDLVKASLALEKLQKKSKVKHLDELVGLNLCLIAFLLYWYGSYTFYPLEYHLLSLPIFVAGVVLILFNLKTLKILFFPILFLLFLVPLPNEIMYTLGGALANFNTQVSYTLLKIFGFPVTLYTSYGAPTINLGDVPFTIDLPCSGIYTLIAFLMFAAFLAFIVSAPIRKKVIIFVFGFFIFEILNVLRITIIISAAAFFGKEIAMQIFHTATGIILIFVGMLLTLFASEKILKIKFFSTTSETPSCPKCKTTMQKAFENFCLNCGKFFNPIRKKPSQTFWAKLIVLLLGCSIIALSINAPTFAITQEIEVASWENTTNILPQKILEYNLSSQIWRDSDYEQLAKQDAALTYFYIPMNISAPVVYVLVNVANSISNLHSWEVCLITWQTAQGQYPLASVLDSRDIQLLEGVPIVARYLVFQYAELNYTQVTLYWYERATFRTGLTVQQKYVRISLVIILPINNGTNYQKHEDVLLDFGQAIASYWEPMKSQSLISLGVPAQQTLLAASIVFIAVTKTTQYTSEWRNRTNNQKIFNNFASQTDKLILETISELSRESKTITTSDINLAIKRKVEKFMKLERLVERLNRLQEYGFIKRDVASNDNKPVLIWKSLVNI
jgi:exosortase